MIQNLVIFWLFMTHADIVFLICDVTEYLFVFVHVYKSFIENKTHFDGEEDWSLQPLK